MEVDGIRCCGHPMKKWRNVLYCFGHQEGAQFSKKSNSEAIWQGNWIVHIQREGGSKMRLFTQCRSSDDTDVRSDSEAFKVKFCV